MATDRKAVRSSSRLTTPTAAPPAAAAAAAKPVLSPRAARSRKARIARSVSRDVEPKPTRRSARQASITSVASESEPDTQLAPKTRRKAPEPVGDLTTVEEIDTQIAIDDEPQTPPRHQPEEEDPVAFRSPGAASEMSGTTAISSFSMAEAEFLESKFILRHIVKLNRSVNEFLDHLVPASNQLRDDLNSIRQMQMPDSDFNEEYRDFDDEISVHVKHFKSEHQDYILLSAVHRALFGPDRDIAATQTGLDLILYLTNVLLFAKSFIHSNRHDKQMWDALRRLDVSFPTYFIPEFIHGTNAPESPAGESALLEQTFGLALDLRTQFAILVLQREASEQDFDPDDAISEVFFDSTTSEDSSGSVFVRGWAVPGLGGDDLILPEQFQDRVTERLNKIREFFVTDVESLDRRDAIDLDGLDTNFPWEAVILRLLHWARLRHGELAISIDGQGGIDAIMNKVKKEIEQPSTELSQGPSLPRVSPRKKRTSFVRSRRRSSSRKFDPNAPVDERLIEVLKAKERGIEAETEAEPSRQEQEIQIDAPAPDTGDERLSHLDDYEPQLGDDAEEQPEEIIETSAPPRSTAGYLKMFKETTRTEKENRTGSIFARQAGAERVEFGDGFGESQATPGPSTKGKGKQHAQSLSRKRPPPVEDDEEDEGDAFEPAERSTQVQERRQKAPVSKRVRIDPNSSSGAPPSHQPPRNTSRPLAVREQEDSFSEPDAPEMTEIHPPSSYQAQHTLAQQNVTAASLQRRRRPRVDWTREAEEIFVEYMRRYPQKYSEILKIDAGPEGHGVLQNRTQVNLKDKARNMAMVMVKSGTGLKPGFEGVLTPKLAQQLIDSGYTL